MGIPRRQDRTRRAARGRATPRTRRRTGHPREDWSASGGIATHLWQRHFRCAALLSSAAVRGRSAEPHFSRCALGQPERTPDLRLSGSGYRAGQRHRSGQDRSYWPTIAKVTVSAITIATVIHAIQLKVRLFTYFPIRL